MRIQSKTLYRLAQKLRCVFILTLMAFTGVVSAQAWPTKPITLLNPFPAGGGTDAFARPLAAQLGEQLGVQVIIDNRGGAGGTVGASVAAKAAPDGYNWFIGASHHTIAPSMYKNLDYDIEKSFIPVALIASPPQGERANVPSNVGDYTKATLSIQLMPGSVTVLPASLSCASGGSFPF